MPNSKDDSFFTVSIRLILKLNYEKFTTLFLNIVVVV